MKRSIDQEAIRKGIAGYAKEQAIILRILRRFGPFTEKDFDRWLKGREYRKRCMLYPRGVTGDSFILGMGVNGGSQWAFWLDLMQHMMALDLIDAVTKGGLVVYSLPRRTIDGTHNRC